MPRHATMEGSQQAANWAQTTRTGMFFLNYLFITSILTYIYIYYRFIYYAILRPSFTSTFKMTAAHSVVSLPPFLTTSDSIPALHSSFSNRHSMIVTISDLPSGRRAQHYWVSYFFTYTLRNSPHVLPTEPEYAEILRNLGASDSLFLSLKVKLSYRMHRKHDSRFPFPEILHCSGEFYSKLHEFTPNDLSDARAKHEIMPANSLIHFSVSFSQA